MTEITSSLIAAAIVLGVIIVIHELGHFFVAKLFGIRVETFSVGFGPRLFGFRRGDTDYRVSALPLGGYVKMSGENPGDSITGDPREFLSKPKWQRFIVAGAGPLMNLILAVVVLTGLYMYGSEVPEGWDDQARIGIVEPGSPADRTGLKVGDLIESLDGKEKPTWQDIEVRVVTKPGKPLPIVVDRGGKRIETTVTPERKSPDDSGYAGMAPLIRTIVGNYTRPNSPAEAAGLKPGDEIISVNGINLRTSGRYIQDLLQTIPEKTFPIVVQRDGNLIELQVTPEWQQDDRGARRRMIGIQTPFPTVLIKLGFSDALRRSVQFNVDNAVLIFQVLGRLFKREASLRSLDGPIGIVRVSGQALERGPSTLINLMALISLNLGLINLLPIPVMDGGVMLMLIVEFLMGRDLSLRLRERIVQVSMVFLLVLMVFVIYNDVLKLLPTSTGPR
jgi:regulator of sigma E protease